MSEKLKNIKKSKLNKKTHIKLHTSQNKGITLIALIITIVVLLILAVVAIRAVQGDGIISRAKEAQTSYNAAQDKEQIQLALNEWKMVENTNPSKTFVKFMEEKFGADKVTANGDDEVTVTLENGHQYKVKKDGTITSTKGIVLASKMTLELNEGTTVTKTLTASLNGIEGTISWSNSDDSKATISAEIGESITLTAVAKGSTIITATCGSYTATCTVTVTEPIEIGSYVQYNVEYEDMYYTGKIYGENDGWRYLGKDDDGNNLIVSTGIPAILYYYCRPGTTLPGWWATDEEIEADTGEYNTSAGWNYDDSGYPSLYAAYGLRYKFESIPFNCHANGASESTTAVNTGRFIKVGSTTSGENINLNFRASGVNVVDVHNLTLAELNRATNKATTPNGTSADTSTSSGFRDLTGTANGLFDMKDLFGEYAGRYSYWLSSKHPTMSDDGLCFVHYNVANVGCYSSGEQFGVRPVVTISSSVQLVDTNGDGVFEIQ